METKCNMCCNVNKKQWTKDTILRKDCLNKNYVCFHFYKISIFAICSEFSCFVCAHIRTQKGNKTPNDQHHRPIQIFKRNSFVV